jgi:hypothetical protein
MAVTGIKDEMLQYSRATEAIFMNKPKNSKAYGIKTPDSTNIVAVLAVIFLVLVVAAQI